MPPTFWRPSRIRKRGQNISVRSTLNALAESPPHLDYLDKLVNKYHQEMSIFWNDSNKGVKLMNVFKDLIFDTASMMLRHLDTEKTARLLRQTKKTASAMFLKLSQIGTIILSENDVQRMFGGMSVLNSSTILEGDLFKHRKTPGPSLPGNAQRWFKPLDLIRIFRPPFTVQSKLDSSRDDGNRLPEVRRIAGKETSVRSGTSAILIADVSKFRPVCPISN
ncbi:hypothetical protein ECG_03144 [Echinococcus granulosus]|nr:hypothetical protein ECG_03144 [Echinococcus granulosus]